MADPKTAPLTDEERAELEELRAEKTRREEEERARRERAELEALRAERDAAAQAEVQPVPQPAPAPRRKPAPAPEPVPPAEKTFGQRMVTTDATDDDGVPAMPPAQKLILLVGAAIIVAFIVWSFIR